MPLAQLVILAREEGRNGALPPIGRRRDIISRLAPWNTAPETAEGDILYGPGIEIELNPGEDEVNQMLLTIVDEDIAWIALLRIARAMKWRLLDPTSGRELKP
jgi:hypothetical protein